MSGYPSLGAFLQEFRVQDLKKISNLLTISVRGRKQEQMQQLMEFLDSLQGEKYDKALNQVRDVFVEMNSERRGYKLPPHMKIAIEQRPSGVSHAPPQVEGSLIQESQKLDQVRQLNQQDGTISQLDQVRQLDQIRQFNQQEQGNINQLDKLLQQTQVLRQTRSMTRHQPIQPVDFQKEVSSTQQSQKRKLCTPQKSIPAKKVNEGKIDCICRDKNAPAPQSELVQCADCGVSQHKRCVLGTAEQIQKPKPSHYCEWCRVKWADPFWKRVPKFKGARSLRICGESGKYSSKVDQPIEIEEKGSSIGRGGYELRMASLQLGDSVDFRFQWPPKAQVEFNGHALEIHKGRQSKETLGAHHRDKSVSVEVFAKRGRNYLKCSMDHDSAYCLVFYMAKKQTIQDVKGMMAPAETLLEAVERVRRTFSDCDGGIDIQKERVSLKCEITSSRLVKPVRFKDTSVFRSFDLNIFLSTCERFLKWQCPYTMKHSRVCNLQVDSYMEEVLRALDDRQDVDQIEINMDGEWRIDENCPWQNVLTKGSVLSFGLNHSGKCNRYQVDGFEDDDDSFDDEADLRQTVAQLAKRSRMQSVNNQKQPEVISLLDDDDDDQELAQTSEKSQQATLLALPTNPPIIGARRSHASGNPLFQNPSITSPPPRAYPSPNPAPLQRPPFTSPPSPTLHPPLPPLPPPPLPPNQPALQQPSFVCATSLTFSPLVPRPSSPYASMYQSNSYCQNYAQLPQFQLQNQPLRMSFVSYSSYQFVHPYRRQLLPAQDVKPKFQHMYGNNSHIGNNYIRDERYYCHQHHQASSHYNLNKDIDLVSKTKNGEIRDERSYCNQHHQSSPHYYKDISQVSKAQNGDVSFSQKQAPIAQVQGTNPGQKELVDYRVSFQFQGAKRVEIIELD